MDYKKILDECKARAEAYRVADAVWNHTHEENCISAISSLLARSAAAEQERDQLREVLDMYGGEEGITELLSKLEKSEAENKDREEASFREHADTHYWRDRARAAEKCVDDVKWARVRSRPAYVVDEILQKFYAEKKE